eukprot:2416942-Pyramimonas_sp.AAC.1
MGRKSSGALAERILTCRHAKQTIENNPQNFKLGRILGSPGKKDNAIGTTQRCSVDWQSRREA